jgi:hypothetical protein
MIGPIGEAKKESTADAPTAKDLKSKPVPEVKNAASKPDEP